MYRGRLWTMRQFAGFGSAQQTNERFKFLLEHGQTGLSTAFDFPTLDGLRLRPRAQPRRGRAGRRRDLARSRDMETLMDGIPMDEVSTSMTINGPAPILLAFYIACGENQGVDPTKLRGTVQNDILKEYQAQHAWLVPAEPALRMITDVMGYCAEHVPQWNTISISGYHIREAGSTAAQELAFTLANGMEYVRRGDRGRARRRRLRAAPLVLLRQPPRLLRGDRQVPRRAPHLGAQDARRVRREGSALVDAALPHADGGRVADGAAAREQHRAHGVRGARGGARRHAVAAHELDGRDARRCRRRRP